MFYETLVVARGFPRCKPNRIPDKMLENKMSEDGKPDKMPDNLTRALTGSGPFMSLFTLTHTLYLSTLSLSISTHKHISFILYTLNLYLSFHAHSLSLSLHTPSLYRYTHSFCLYFKTHRFPPSAHTFHLSFSGYLIMIGYLLT